MTIAFHRAGTSRKFAPVLLIGLFLAASVACAGLPGGAPAADPSPTPVNAPEPPAMSASDTATTTLSGVFAEVKVDFKYVPAGRSLQVRYRVENRSDAALAVFDRGDRHAVLTRRLVAGDVPSPLFLVEQDVGLTLSHEALPLPDPAPTSPPTPLAARLAPGASLEAGFAFTLPESSDAKRLRWCLGVAPFTPGDYSAAEAVGGVDLWRASFAVVKDQQRLCTPWFDLAGGRFSDDDS